MPEYLALNKPLILDMDIGVSENWKRFKQKNEVYVIATGIKEKAWQKVQAFRVARI